VKQKALLRDRLYDSIKERILTGVYQAGERLMLDELAETFGVSKTPVKEALHALRDEGLLDIIPRTGYFVSHITVRDVQEIFQMRLILEGAAAELAAQHITEQELRGLEQMHIGYVPGDIESYWEYLRENHEFHRRVAVATRNRWLADAVARLLDQMQRLLLLRLDLTESADGMVEEHRQLVAALRKRDPMLARKTMVDAIENARKVVFAAITQRAALPLRLPD
jgi:DNA-binding GntR family transcriptional regulator